MLVSAAAFATAIETANNALAPNRSFLSVPSRDNRVRSIPDWFRASNPITEGPMILVTFPTAVRTPKPPYRLSLVSLSSWASNRPLDAPEGTENRPNPRFVWTSAWTVGLPLESSTSRAWILSIMKSLASVKASMPSFWRSVKSGIRASVISSKFVPGWLSG